MKTEDNIHAQALIGSLALHKTYTQENNSTNTQILEGLL